MISGTDTGDVVSGVTINLVVVTDVVNQRVNRDVLDSQILNSSN